MTVPVRWRSALGLLLAVLLVWTVRHAGTALVVTREVTNPGAIISLASHEWERLPEAAAQSKRSATSLLLLTTPVEVSALNCYHCSDREGWLTAAGVERERIVLLPWRVHNTFDEARAALAFCRSRGVKSLLVVTSPYHSRRALAVFNHVFENSGVEIGVQPAVAYSKAIPRRWWETPFDRWYVRYEWAAQVYYAVRYGVL